MGIYTQAILIGVIVFVSIVLVALVTRLILSKRRKARGKNTLFKPSFERAHARVGKDDERQKLRRTMPTAPKKGPEAKGRFYAFGALIAVLFGTLGIRLWTLQVLASDRYLNEANENMTSDVSTPATRGRILDRNGIELVANRASTVLTGKRDLINQRGLVHRLSLLLGIPKGIVRRNLLNDTAGAQADTTIATDVPMRTVAFIKEHPNLFKGVNVEKRTLRYYPYGSLAAHILGYTGPVTEEMLADQTEDDSIHYEQGDIVGRDGAEFIFDQILQGTRGTRTYRVDSAGNPTALIDEIESISGNDVCLTIDAHLQRSTDRIIIEVMAAARQKGYVNANAGALVCIDIKDGGILASSSYPTFYPSDLSGGISLDLWEQLTNDASEYPLTNRVISGLYPSASTIKAFSGIAGLTYGVIKDDTHFYCNGFWDDYGEQWGQRCWIYPSGHGYLSFEEALNQSCDVYFYNVGSAFYDRWEKATGGNGGSNSSEGEGIGSSDEDENNTNGRVDGNVSDGSENVFQNYLESWGFGHPTGIDLPGEAGGLIPDEAWKWDAFGDTPEEALWQPGDMTNMAIGQGDLLVTPLQLANGYATIARRRALKPHVFHKILNKEGNAIVNYLPQESDTQPQFDHAHLDRVVDGLRRVVLRIGVFIDIPITMAGKSGTAEVANKDEFSWFVAYGPLEDPQYCVACVIEQGGGGSSTAIMGVLHTFAAIYGIDVGEIYTSVDTGER